ncbi:MAG: aminopeptidase [Candidatus Shapirobacteria bacterium]|jgi:aminopeptidase
MTYLPEQKYLDTYADILINFGLNGGKGIKKGEVVFLEVPECAKPLLFSLLKSVLTAGAHPIIQYLPDGLDPHFLSYATEEQLSFFPAKFLKGKIKEADHFVKIIADTDLHQLEGIDPQKIMQKNIAMKPFLDWRNRKEINGKLSWTLGLYPTQAMAKEAGMTLKSAWEQIIRACYLDHQHPLDRWRQIESDSQTILKKLNHLPINSLRIQAKNTDLIIGLDKHRKWLSGGGCNIPSFEVFISPDCHRTSGHISFSLPLYRYGNQITDIYLEFKDGHVVSSSATKGESVLKKMIATKNADMVGEFSLTDIRFSKINRFMAETLYDENFGGKYGNTHLALGMSFHESYTGNPKKVTGDQWKIMGFNDSVIHTDIISISDRVVTATLDNGQQIIIYKKGRFTL